MKIRFNHRETHLSARVRDGPLPESALRMTTSSLKQFLPEILVGPRPWPTVYRPDDLTTSPGNKSGGGDEASKPVTAKEVDEEDGVTLF